MGVVEIDSDINAVVLKHNLEMCKSMTHKIISELSLLKKAILIHHGRVLKAKTSGTTVTTFGTGLALTGLIMAPFTLGTSLIVSTVGAVTTVGGATANLITDLVDRNKKNKFIHHIQELAAEQQTSKLELATKLEVLVEILHPLITSGLTKTEALFAVLIHGDRYTISDDNDSLDSKEEEEGFEWVEDVDGKWIPVKKFCFKAGINSLKLIKNTKTLRDLAAISSTAGGAAFNATTQTASAAATTGASSITAGIGRILGSAAFRTTMAAVGVVFTTIDIALLVKQWKDIDPTEETVNFVIKELEEELEHYSLLIGELETVINCKLFLGYVDNVPFVGSSPLAVEALIGILEGRHLTHRIYESLANIDIKTSLELTHRFVDKVVHFDKSRATLAKDEDEFEKRETAEPIGDIDTLLHNFNQTVTDTSQLFDQDIFKLNQLVIDTFLCKKEFPPIKDIRGILSQQKSTILSDYDSPLPPNIEHLVKDVLIAYHQVGEYVNCNKWEYTLVLEALIELFVSYFIEEYDNIFNEIDNENETENGRMDQIHELVEVLVCHKSFLNPVAVAIWNSDKFTSDEGRQDKLNTTFESISLLFRNLKFKIPVWACEIQGVVNK